MLGIMRHVIRYLVVLVCCVATPRGQGVRGRGGAAVARGKGARVSSELAGPNLLLPEAPSKQYNHTFPGCWLGGHFYMVGDRWSPSIEPLGVVYCVKCQCAQIVKGGEVQLKGKVVCANIKADCPRVGCRKPVLRPQTCCKVCPGQEPYFEDQFGQDFPDVSNVVPPGGAGTGTGTSSKDKPDMTSLLVGSTFGRRKPVRTRAVAAMHVSKITDSSFHYVIQFSRLKSPIQLRLTDQYGKVLLERPIPTQTSRSKRLSGVWSDVPSVSMYYIVRELAFVSMATTRHRTGEISGRLKTNTMASTATFEAVLTPPIPRGFGGFAQMFYDDVTSVGSYVIHIDGLKYIHQDEFFVTFEKDTEIIHQHILRISKSKSQIVGKLTVDKQTSKQLARGRLHMRVTSRTGDTITGVIRPRMLRYDLLAVFQGEGAFQGIHGFVALTLGEDGAIRYKMAANGYKGTEVGVTLQRGTKRRWKSFATLPHAPEIHTADQLTRSGYYKKLRARDTVAVLENRIRLEVPFGSGSDVINSLFQPVSTSSVNVFTASHAVLKAAGCSESVLVLYTLTPYCTFAYHVISQNMTSSKTASLRLSDVYSFRESPTNDSPEGTISAIPDTIFRSLRSGEAELTWRFASGSCQDVASQRITVPNTCVSPSRPGLSGADKNEAERETNAIYRCYHEGAFYTQGDTWAPADVNKCITCRCDKGSVFCEEMPCPPTDCRYPRKREEECCPVCEDDNDTERKVLGSCYYHGDKRWHPVGSNWHPYVPPFGYSKCAVCTCLAGSLEVNCTRLPCPELNCPQYQRIRLNREDCCQVCRESRFGKAVSSISKNNDCNFGNKIYKHGQKWHPWLTPFGEMKCYICSCKNGKSRCKKLRCPRLTCDQTFQPTDQCCPVCRDSSKRPTSPQTDRRPNFPHGIPLMP